MTARRPLITAGGYLQELAGTDTLQLNAGATAGASANLPHGAAPTSPTDGDIWTTTSGLYVRIDGATVGPLGAGGGSPGGSSGQIQYNNAGAFGAFTASGDATIDTATGAVDLATVNSDIGSFGDATHTGAFTVNAKGLVTAASSVAITASGIGAAPADALDIQWFGDGSDGDLSISSGTTILTRDTYYHDVTLTGTARIDPGGYRLYVSGTLDISAAAAGAISIAANNGGGGNVGAGGSGGSGLGSHSVGGSAGGGNGGNAGTGAGSQAPTTAAPENAVGGLGANGGKGGSSGATAGGAQRVALTTNTGPADVRRLTADLIGWIALANPNYLQGGFGASGGGGGAGDGVGGVAGGGGGGGGGGVIYLAARTINRSGSTAAGAIAAKGGDGGAGRNSNGGTNPAGAGGGGGGGGGYIYLIYRSLTGSLATAALDATGGNGGAGGNGAGTGAGGDGGGAGGGGRIDVYDLGAGTQSITDKTAPSAGNAASGSTGGAAKVAAAQQVNL